MVFRQFIHDDLGCASYLVGDEDAGAAAVVDPGLDIGGYLAVARYVGVRIAHVLETHNHADHVSGHGRLVEATGATMHVHRAAQPSYDHEPFDDGWELELGRIVIRALHTPGHRPEHTAFALIDTTRGSEPWAVLTGDSLFVGDIARPDLAVEPREGARGIYTSLRERLLSLPRETEIWPGHLGGSMCGGPTMSMKVSSTIGYEQSHNALLGDLGEDEFVAASLAALGPQPPNFSQIVALNRGPLSTFEVPLAPLTPQQVERHAAEGAAIIDVRTELQFDEAHVPGAICVTALRAGFGTRLAWIADPEQSIVLVGRDDEEARHAARLAASVGVLRVTGYLSGGMTSWREERRPVGRTPRVTVERLHELCASDPDVQILDVREKAEWAEVRIPGSIHCPYHDLANGFPDELDLSRPIAVVCASGQRSAVAASLLQRGGAESVLHVVDGGVKTWESEGYGVERDASRA